jgi:diguanylate cyclase (GGDEF)-like protein/PAS domain S-box-containing protein
MSVTTGSSERNSETAAHRELLDLGFAGRLLDALRDPAYFVDVRGRTLHWNQAAARFTGYSADEMVGQAASNSRLGLTDAAGVPLRTDDYLGKRTIREGRSIDRMASLRRRDGKRVPVAAHCSPIRDEEGGMAGVLVVLRDAASDDALRRALRQARQEAESDPLTGLANRRALARMLDIQLQVQMCEGRPLCLVLADLDHFKSVNDGWGHACGDRVLAAFADLLRHQSRAEDLVARYGGEEFMILLPDASLEVATRVAERLRVATPDVTPPEMAPRRLTASFGVAEAAPGEPASRFLLRADAALYRAKAAGRDRVEVSPADDRREALPAPSELRALRPDSPR